MHDLRSRRIFMLPIAITMLLLALVVAGFGTFGTLSAGAFAFAAGFLILGVISTLSYFRGHPSVA